MPTLEALWRAVFPAARPAAADSHLQRPVAWVRVLKARVPAFDALEPDDLAILPAAALESLSGLAVEPDSVVEAVARAGGSGVLVVGAAAGAAAGDRNRESALMERAAALGLGGFLLDEGDVSALERSAIAYIVNGQAELERRAAALESELERVALAGAGAEGMAATIARFLSRPVAIETADGALLALHAPVGAAADGAAVAEYLKRGRGAALRVPLPAADGVGGRRGRRRGSGALLLLGGGRVSELERLATRRVAALIALEIGRRPAAGEGAGERVTDGLPSDGPPWVVLVARQLDETLRTTLEERERIRDELRRSEPARRLALRGDAASLELRLVAAPGPDDDRGLALAGRLSIRLARPVAVSRPFAEPEARPVMEAQARAALEAMEALPVAERRQLAGADGALVAPADQLAAYRLMAALPALPDGLRQAQTLLQPILGGRRDRERETLATLRAVVDHAGQAEAASALGIHRNTLAYRLRRIEEASGWRLADPMLRFSLGIAVRLVQSAREVGADEAPSAPRRRPPRR